MRVNLVQEDRRAYATGETAMREPSQSGISEVDGRARAAGLADAQRQPSLTIHSRPDGHRMVVTVCGDLELATDQQLHRSLRSALTRSDHGIDLDLSSVEFCGCSGLNTLLSIRRQALDHAKTAVIREISPAAERLLTLTDTLSLFTSHDTSGQEDGTADTEPTTSQPEDPEPDPRVEVVQLRRAMQTRDTIDLARGIVMAVFTLSPEEAWQALVMTSQNTNTKLHRTARQLVDSVTGDPLPHLTKKQLTAAAARVTAARDARNGRG